MIDSREELQEIKDIVEGIEFVDEIIPELIETLETAWDERDDYKGQLELIKKQAWKRVELIDGDYVTFVGVHALAWEQHWGPPEVAFNRWDDMPVLEEEQTRDEADTKIENHIEELEKLLPGDEKEN